jgi:mono/diheme cytochrome c family protein
MSTKILAAVCFLGALCSLAGVAACAQSQSKEVKKAPVQTTAADSGSEMLRSYCAPCHGTDGKENGPAATSLKNPPANLRELAKKNKGEFPADHVATVLRSGVSGAHGSSDMPVWGPLFTEVSGRDQGLVQMRISNLVRYLESIQEK